MVKQNTMIKMYYTTTTTTNKYVCTKKEIKQMWQTVKNC